MNFIVALMATLLIPSVAFGLDMGKIGKAAGDVAVKEGAKAGKAEANKTVVNKVNAKLLAEGRKNQCSFKSGSDELEPGCDGKAKKLSAALVDAKKVLTAGGLSGFKFVVSGHTDSSGDAKKNQELSEKRAQVMVKQLVAKGVPAGEIEAVGMGSSKLLVKPDTTDAKKAKNRRYEIQVKI